jgi:toxin ParE1/3/4
VRNVRFQPPARKDIVNIYLESAERFGAAARTRYEALFDAAFRDLAANPARPGVRRSRDVPENVFLYHVRYSVGRVQRSLRVSEPRHFIIFVHTDEEVVILRVLHDSMDIGRHVQVSEDESE